MPLFPPPEEYSTQSLLRTAISGSIIAYMAIWLVIVSLASSSWITAIVCLVIHIIMSNRTDKQALELASRIDYVEGDD